MSGHGTYAVDEQGIFERKASGACNENSEPTHLAGYIKASGRTYRTGAHLNTLNG